MAKHTRRSRLVPHFRAGSRAILGAWTLMAWTASSAAAGDPTTFVQVAGMIDNQEEYFASFRATNAKAHGPGVSVSGNYVVITTSSFWKFEATHDVALLEVAQASDIRFKFKGEHLVAPHPPEAAPNFLPEIATPPFTLQPGRSKRFSIWGGVDHAGPDDHIDTYKSYGTTRSRQLGQTTSITSTFEVYAIHAAPPQPPATPTTPTSSRGCVIWRLAAALHYDVDDRSLRLNALLPQVLDTQGCSTNAIEPAFASDPVLGASLLATNLTVLDMNPDGSYPITQGDFTLLHPSLEASLAATLAPSTLRPGHDPFFWLREGAIIIAMDDDELPISTALDMLAERNVVGSPNFPGATGLILRAEPLDGQDLIAATQGFTQSLTLAVAITLTSPPPIPPPLCDGIDFNNDGSSFDPTDIEAFLSVFSEGPCIPAGATCNDIDFNNDGALFDPCDIDSFLLVFSEGPCTLCGV